MNVEHALRKVDKPSIVSGTLLEAAITLAAEVRRLQSLQPIDLKHLEKCIVCGDKAYRIYPVCSKHMAIDSAITKQKEGK